MLRVTLLRLQQQEHVILLTLHHIITDGWSSTVFVHELVTLYRTNVARQQTTLPPLPIQYADYTLWQRQLLQGPLLDAQLAYWRKQLAEVSPIPLPTDHPRPAIQSYRGARQEQQLPPMLSEALIALSRSCHVTLFMTLLSAFQVLLLRYTGQSDIVVGTPIANRRQAELEGLIGFFVNTLVMRADLGGDPTFLQVLAQTRETALQAYTHQDIPFEKIVEALQPERDLSRSPLFQVMFVLQHAELAPAELLEAGVRPLAVESTMSKFDLTLAIAETEQGLRCSLEYCTDLFESESIARPLKRSICWLRETAIRWNTTMWQNPNMEAHFGE